MRLNKYLSHYYGLSRRQADELIEQAQVMVDGRVANLGQQIDANSKVEVKNHNKGKQSNYIYLALNKPPNYVCSRKDQGDAPTIYELLPKKYHSLKTVGRLDKNSSGLILLTNDGDFAHKLTHPKFAKQKIYLANLDKPLTVDNLKSINEGVELKDGSSKLNCQLVEKSCYKVTIHQGRNRQIRRTFGALDYQVIGLERIAFGDFSLSDLQLKPGRFKTIEVK